MDELLKLLSTTEYISGEKLCMKLGMTRAAIWKRVEKLRAEGYRIHAAGKRGYLLEPVVDCLLPAYVSKALTTEWAGCGELFYAREMTSTNVTLKDAARAGAPKGSLALCELQTQGRGRMQRVWESGEGESLMQSLLLCPKLSIEHAPLCTLAAAVAIAQAIEDTCPTLHAHIKWPNDIIIGGRKCVGILSELSADMDGIDWMIMGVGVNVNQRGFADALEDTATSLWLEQAKLSPKEASIDRSRLLCAYLLRMEQAMEAIERSGLEGILEAYTARSATLGRCVRVIGATMEFVGTAEAVDQTGALMVRDQQGELCRVLSGDVSVRGVMGYV